MTRIEGYWQFLLGRVDRLHDRIPVQGTRAGCWGCSDGNIPDILYTVEDVRNVKEGAKIFHKDPKSRILGILRIIT